MAIKVVTIDSELESAKRLGYPTHTWLGDYAYKFDNDIIIRWGNSGFVYSREGARSVDFKNVVNPAKNIKQNCRKNEAIKLLAQVVNVPTIYDKSVPKDVLAVVRPMEHAAGNGFSVQKGPVKIQPGTYGTRFIKTDTEYRVWFCGNRTMCGRRVKMKINEDQEFPCRSNWGYEFSTGIAPELHKQTLLAAKKIGLQSGAADLLFHKGKYYFLELNSAPSVDHRVVREFYQNAIEALVRRKFPEMFGEPKKEQAPPAPAATEPSKKSEPVAGESVVVLEVAPAVAPTVAVESAVSAVSMVVEPALVAV